MDTSLNQLADMVINEVQGGLGGSSNYSLSKEQLKLNLIMLRNRISIELFYKKQLNIEDVAENINCLVFKKKRISQCCAVSEADKSKKVLHAVIPKLVHAKGFEPIVYVGETELHQPFRIAYGNEYAYRKYDTYTSQKPIAWIKPDGIWIINPPTSNKASYTARAFWENPRELYQYGCCGSDDNSPFACPASVQEMIISKLSNDYLRNYKLSQPMPNYQIDQPKSQPQK